MPKLYVVSDSQAVLGELVSAFDFISTDITTFSNAIDFLAACYIQAPDLAVLDLQITNMGGMAICMELHLEESGGRLPHIPVLMLLDRRADIFLATRSNAEGYLVKPLNSIRLADAAKEILSGKTYLDRSHKPTELAK